MRKSTKKLLGLTAFAAISLSMLAGCTNNTSEKTKITFWHTMGANLQAVLDRIISDFNEIYPDITIEHSSQGGYDDLEGKINDAIPAGTTPTIAYCYPDHVAEYLESNAVISVSDFVNDPELGFSADDGLVDDFITAYWQEGQEYKTEGIYSVPFAKSTEVMFYNKTIFDDAAHHASGQVYQVPTTWESMETLMAQMKVDYPTIIPLGYDDDANFFITLCEQYGIPYTSLNTETGKGSADFNNDAAKAMVSKMVDWYNAGYLLTQGVNGNAYTSTAFTDGTLAMTIGSTGGTSYNYTANFPVGTAQVPQPDATSPFSFGGSLEKTDHIIMQGPSVCFFRKGTQAQKEAAWKFYKFAVKALNSATFSVASGYSPVRESSFTCSAMTDYLNSPQTGSAALIQTTVNLYQNLTSRYYVSPAFHGSSTCRNQVNGIFANVALGTKTLNDAFAYAYAKSVFAIGD